MPQLIMSRREFAGVPVTMTTATTLRSEYDHPRRVVALGWISRNGGQVTVSDQLTRPVSTSAGR
jgi:fructose 1,6-bisphosphatase